MRAFNVWGSSTLTPRLVAKTKAQLKLYKKAIALVTVVAKR